MGSLINFPDPIKAWKLKEDVAMARERYAYRQRRIEAAARMAAIPEIYIGKGFNDLVITFPKLEQIRDRCFYYANYFQNVRAMGANLVILGSNGTGKGHLSCAILQHVLGMEFTGLFITQSDLLSRIRSSYSREATQREEDVIGLFRSPDLLVIDEIGVTVGNQSRNYQAQLYDIINHRCCYRLPTIMTANMSETEIRRYLGERIWDRMTERTESKSEIIHIDGPSWRQIGTTRATA